MERALDDAVPPWVGPILAQARDGVVVFDAAGGLLFLNDALTEMLRIDHRFPMGMSVLDVVHPDDLGRAGANLSGVAEGATPYAGLLRLQTGDGGWITAEVTPFRVELDPPPSGPGPVTVAFVRDPSLNDAHWSFLTSLSGGEPFDASVARLAEGLSTEVDGPLAITFVDGGVVRHVGPVPRILAAIDAEGGLDETPGAPWTDAMALDAPVAVPVAGLPAAVRAAAESVGAEACVVVPVPDPAGGPPALLVQWPPRLAMADILREALVRRPRQAVALALDRRDAQRRLEHLAHHDALSGLANRGRFFALLAEMAVSGEPFGVCYVDLDRFKPVNDTLGHVAGDQVIAECARRLREVVANKAPGPRAVVGRLGGDEFAVAVPAVGSAALDDLAAAIVDATSVPLVVAGLRVEVGASVGCARSDGGDDPDAVVAAADVALYEAKRAGRGTWRRYARPDLDAAGDDLGAGHPLPRARRAPLTPTRAEPHSEDEAQP